MNVICRTFASFRTRRGFLLLVVIGLLAVLLSVCLGLLSVTRSETEAVSTLRDKMDGVNLYYSAVDWMAGNMVDSLISGGKFDASKYVSRARDNSTWWYRSCEPGMSSWINANVQNVRTGNSDATCSQVKLQDEAPWVYLPADYFPEGGMRARFSVLVLDPNSVPCVNDWLEDGNPTQCQCAHMFMDGLGEQQVEAWREWRDTGTFNGMSIEPAAINPTTARNFAPIRYHEAWRVVTRSTRYMYWPIGNQYNGHEGQVSPNWVTTNAMWMGLYGPDMCALKPLIQSDGIAQANLFANGLLSGNYLPPLGYGTGYSSSTSGVPLVPKNGYEYDTSNPSTGLYCAYKSNACVGGLPQNIPFSLLAYTDPDTGRCPINVNTCPNSGERIPTNVAFFNKPYANGSPAYSMEAVFNVESLRRIVTVGAMTYKDQTGAAHAVASPAAANIANIADPNARALAWQKHEQLRTKLAYQYQETLCRYFTGTYRHPMNRAYPPFYNKVVDTPIDYSDDGTFAQVYGVNIGCSDNSYAKTRFPEGVIAFRNHVKQDLQTISAGVPALVNFDAADVPSVAQGKLDMRTADAVYDNIVPGPATIWGSYPCKELYDLRLARAENEPNNTDMTDTTKIGSHANVYNYFDDALTHVDPGYRSYHAHADGVADPLDNKPLYLRPKGMDLALNTAPDGPYEKRTDAAWRQQAFGPDWFSTELTTATTTFTLIVNVQLCDAQSVLADPANPRVLLSSQWGTVLEIAPDITKDNDSWYAGDMPRRVKTEHNPSDFYCMDKNASLLRKVNSNDMPDGDLTNEQLETTRQQPEILNEPINAGITNTMDLRCPTAAREWIDWRGAEDLPTDRASLYGSNSTAKNIRLRSIWCLNQGVK